MQQRGKIVDAENHVVLTETYPKHALSETIPSMKTCTELLAYRKGIEKEDIRCKKTKRDEKVAHLQKIQFKDYYRPDEFVENPQYTATW